MANPGIYAQFAQPVRSVGDYLGDMDRREGNALELAMKRLQQRTTERGMADDDTARRIFAQYGDKARNPLMEAGLAKQAFALDDRGLALRKSEADIASTGANTRKAEQEIDSKKLADAKTRIELAGSAAKFVMDNPSAENAIRAVDYLSQNGAVPPEQAQKMIQEIQANPTPENAKRLATLAYQSALSAEKQLTQYFNQNRGGTFAVAGVNPVTGASADVQSAPITQSADNAATQATSLTNNAATDLRMRELDANRARDEALRREQVARDAALTRGQSAAQAAATLKLQQDKFNWDKSRPVASAAGAPGAPAGKPMTEFQIAQRRDKIAKDYKAAQTTLASMADLKQSAAAVLGAPGLDRATGVAAYLPSYPGGQAAAAEVALQNLEGKVTQLGKAAAAMAGAIGPMAVQEWKIVRDMIAAIDPKKGKKPLEEQVALVVSAADGAAARLQDAYQKQYSPDFERFPEFENLGTSGPKPASPEDAQAREWATKNPNDPRAKQIMQRLGGG
jgi:hypothetical protein